MEEIPEGETFHFQACLEDPEWERDRMRHRRTGDNWEETPAPEEPALPHLVRPCPCLSLFATNKAGGRV